MLQSAHSQDLQCSARHALYVHICMVDSWAACDQRSIHNNRSRPSLALTNANRQIIQVVPWTSHSALVLSTLALLVTSEGEKCSPTDTTLINWIHGVPRHQLALWVVPLYCSGHWFCGLHTVYCLRLPDSQRQVRWWAVQDGHAILQDSSRDCSERWQEEQLRQRAGA